MSCQHSLVMEKPIRSKKEGIEYTCKKQSFFHSDEHIIESEGYTIPITSIYLDKQKINLKKPVKVRIYKEDGVYIAENTNLWLFGSGETPDEALDSFRERFEIYYNSYSKNLPDELSKDALSIKRLYESLI
jgi:hypothetical protein